MYRGQSDRATYCTTNKRRRPRRPNARHFVKLNSPPPAAAAAAAAVSARGITCSVAATRRRRRRKKKKGAPRPARIQFKIYFKQNKQLQQAVANIDIDSSSRHARPAQRVWILFQVFSYCSDKSFIFERRF